jgi:hypothetical protein
MVGEGTYDTPRDTARGALTTRRSTGEHHDATQGNFACQVPLLCSKSYFVCKKEVSDQRNVHTHGAQRGLGQNQSRMGRVKACANLRKGRACRTCLACLRAIMLLVVF